jgi:two-component system OmpR family sensor kinase
VAVDARGIHQPLAMDDPMGPEPGGHVIILRETFKKTTPGEHGTIEYRHVERSSDERLAIGPPPPMMMHGGAFGFDHGPATGMWLARVLRLQTRFAAIPGGEVIVSVDPRPLAHTISAFWLAMLPIGLFAILVAWLMGRYITNQALRPLVQTTAALRQFAAGDFTPRAIVTADRNEIGELVTAYNGAVAQVSSAFEERRVAEGEMRRFIADAGHELRTPLTVVMGFIDVLRRRGSGDIAERANASNAGILDTMLIESRRMRALIDRLIALARLDNADSRALDVDLGALAGQIGRALEPLDPDHRITLRIEENCVVRADEAELRDAIANVAENALKYAPKGPVEIVVQGERDDVRLTVTDGGPGIAADERARVFERFYRGEQRGTSEGFGLGLAIAKRAVERAGGTIDITDAPGAGTRVAISLPRSA